jgi:hypothetical protein
MSGHLHLACANDVLRPLDMQCSRSGHVMYMATILITAQNRVSFDPRPLTVPTIRC